MVVGVVGLVAAVVAIVVVTTSGGGDGDEGPTARVGEATTTTAGGDVEGWESELGAESTLLATDGTTVCSTTVGNQLFCLDTANGEDRITVDLENTATAPTLIDGTVIVGASSPAGGNVYAYSLAGERLWRVSASVHAEARLPVAGGVVTVIDRHQLLGIDVASGEERWRVYTSEDLEDPRAMGDDTFTDGTRVYALMELIDVDTGSASTHVVAHDPQTGVEVWRSPRLGDIPVGLRLVDAAGFADGATRAFLLQGEQRQLVVLDAASGELRWEVPLATEYASVAVAEGRVILADGPDTRAYDAAGAELWHVPSPVIARSPGLIGPGELVVSEGRLFVAGVDVFSLDPATGVAELVREDVSANDVAVVDGWLLIAGRERLEARTLE